jgi:hypothetical protein
MTSMVFNWDQPPGLPVFGGDLPHFAGDPNGGCMAAVRQIEVSPTADPNTAARL